MAVSDRTQRLLKREASTVTMVTPADGPSLPTAPAGKWMWMSVASRLPQEMPYCDEGEKREEEREYENNIILYSQKI